MFSNIVKIDLQNYVKKISGTIPMLYKGSGKRVLNLVRRKINEYFSDAKLKGVVQKDNNVVLDKRHLYGDCYFEGYWGSINLYLDIYQ